MNRMNPLTAPPSSASPAALGAAPNPNASPKAVGKQFEGIFASMLIKQMRETGDGESLFGKDPGDIVGGMFDHFLGEQLGRTGSLGIANMIRSQLERRVAQA
jgi:flagellar protein FlgJ